MEKTKGNDGMTLIVAVNYGARQEILDAVRSCVDDARAALREGRAPEELSEESFARRLHTAGIPDPDLLIRTSGEMRVSNFLLCRSPTRSSCAPTCSGRTSTATSFCVPCWSSRGATAVSGR